MIIVLLARELQEKKKFISDSSLTLNSSLERTGNSFEEYKLFIMEIFLSLSLSLVLQNLFGSGVLYFQIIMIIFIKYLLFTITEFVIYFMPRNRSLKSTRRDFLVSNERECRVNDDTFVRLPWSAYTASYNSRNREQSGTCNLVCAHGTLWWILSSLLECVVLDCDRRKRSKRSYKLFVKITLNLVNLENYYYFAWEVLQTSLKLNRHL